MSRMVIEVPVELHETLSRRAGERGEAVEVFALTCLRAGAAQVSAALATPDEVVCSFCGKTRDQIQHMVTGRNVRICGECVAECDRLLERAAREAHSGAAL